MLQTRWTRSLECSTTSLHGRRYPSKSSMRRVYNTHISPVCAGFYIHAGYPNMIAVVLRQMQLRPARKSNAACNHPRTYPNAPE